ncbi:hypothetical protein BsIDN1_41880 [Bacillus safensis]|uniref:Putative aromatic acid exporter C-terminal domain-containing protein n=1 Tax=Bacillus safensis TaxID=561879 RepID=A0A5S9MAL2_BACIA|nr:hypothetical protein BsIDN1_41880 [Bacillus safensis]
METRQKRVNHIMFKIGYRTLKTALGTAIAIYIAQLLGLQNYSAAGITILCIQVTKKRSLLASGARFAACSLAILFSYLFFFDLIGYHPFVIGLMLLVFIPTTVLLRIKEGIVTSSVIILHLYMSGGITLHLIWNELLLITIGVGVALIMNLYMPSVDKKLKRYSEQIEANFAKIFEEIEQYLMTGKQDWTGKEIPETHQLIKEAKALAYRDVEKPCIKT